MTAVVEVTAPQRRHRAARLTWRQLSARPMGVIGAVHAAVALLVAIFAPLLAPYDPYAYVRGHDLRHLPAAVAAHPLGTDDGGKDVLSSLIYGARVSLIVGFTAAAITIVIGGLIGIVAGYRGGSRRARADAHHRFLPGHPRNRAADRDRGDRRPVADQHHPGHRRCSAGRPPPGWCVRRRCRCASGSSCCAREAIGAGDVHILRRHISRPCCR